MTSRVAHLLPTVVLATAFVLALVVGTVRDVPRTFALDCQPVNDNCTGGDTSKTSAMEVNHLVPGGAGGPVLVEPEVGEHVAVTAFWRPAANCQGLEATESATADVAWSGSSWTLSNVNLTSNINALTICLGASCSYGGVTHSWQYKLITDVTDPGPNGWNLQKVRYEITDVDDGDTIAGPQSTSSECVEVSAVTPTSQSFTGWDNPNDKWSSSRCAFSCDAVGGSMTVTYQ